MKTVPDTPDPDPGPHTPCGRIRATIAREGLGAYSESTTTSGCPTDPAVLCETFEIWSADPWMLRARAANIRYGSCGCEDRPALPSAFTLDCSRSGLTCEDVCEAFLEWACAYRLWALQITKAIDGCFDDWSPEVRVPRVPRCGSCEQTCRAMNGFHRKLARWFDDIRYPLNELCDPGGTNKVPPPPEPPPFD